MSSHDAACRRKNRPERNSHARHRRPFSPRPDHQHHRPAGAGSDDQQASARYDQGVARTERRTEPLRRSSTTSIRAREARTANLGKATNVLNLYRTSWSRRSRRRAVFCRKPWPERRRPSPSAGRLRSRRRGVLGVVGRGSRQQFAEHGRQPARQPRSADVQRRPRSQILSSFLILIRERRRSACRYGDACDDPFSSKGRSARRRWIGTKHPSQEGVCPVAAAVWRRRTPRLRGRFR